MTIGNQVSKRCRLSQVGLAIILLLLAVSASAESKHDEAVKESGKAKGHREAAEKLKPEERKKEYDEAIKAWLLAAVAADSYDTVAGASFRQEAAKDHRAIGEDGKAAGLEEGTAKAIAALARKAAAAKDPKRASELFKLAESKWNQAATDHDKSDPKNKKPGEDAREEAKKMAAEAKKQDELLK